MQSVCSLLPSPYFDRVVEARALVSEDRLIGAVYDPPFAHFTHQLAEEYDWDGLTEALREFARTHEPFEARTGSLSTFYGQSAGIGISVQRDPQWFDYHTAIWDVVSRFASGRVDPFYSPNTLLPHVTIKRCVPNPKSFQEAVSKLATTDFKWTFTIDSVSVQCDPGHNSQTHYQRISFPLGKAATARQQAPATNATILAVTRGDATPQIVRVQSDGAGTEDIEVDAASIVRLMAAAKSSTVHWPGGRCRVEDGRVVLVEANPPFPIAY